MASRARKKAQRRSNQPNSQRHHYVPAGYLGFFADPPHGRRGRLWVWDKERGRTWTSTPDGVAWIEDFYRLDPDDGDDPHAIEKALSVAEGKAISAIREIAANPRTKPRVQQAEAVVSFVSLQVVRGPELRENFEAFADRVAKMILGIVSSKPETYEATKKRLLARDPTLVDDELPTFEAMREAVRDVGIEIKLNDSYLVGAILNTQPGVFRLLASMHLGFHWVDDGEELVTASQPVILLRNPTTPSWMGVGVGTAAAVVMPLTPKLLFMATPAESDILVAPAVPGLASEVNRRLSHQSMQVYSRTQFEFDPTPLDQPGRHHARTAALRREVMKRILRGLLTAMPKK